MNIRTVIILVLAWNGLTFATQQQELPLTGDSSFRERLQPVQGDSLLSRMTRQAERWVGMELVQMRAIVFFYIMRPDGVFSLCFPFFYEGFGFEICRFWLFFKMCMCVWFSKSKYCDFLKYELRSLLFYSVWNTTEIYYSPFCAFSFMHIFLFLFFPPSAATRKTLLPSFTF